jgi:hypothetical protein
MARKSGWKTAQIHRVSGLVNSPLAIVPCEWECLLKLAGLSEEEAVHSHAVQNWVRRYCHSRYVPTKVLDALSISQESCL